MLLAIDAGNTNIVFALFDGHKKLLQHRVETGKDFSSVLSSFSSVDSIIISSVVPYVNDVLREKCLKFFNQNPLFVSYENAGILTTLDKPEEVGADRLVNSVAAREYYQTPCVIVDLGTATTFDVVDAAGKYDGGVIAPGINLSLEALYKAAAKLPEVAVEKPENVIGRNTKDAMQSGIYWGYISLIEGTLNRIESEMGQKPFVIATGGLSPLFATGTDRFKLIDQDLTLKGLLLIHARYVEKKSGKGA